MPGTLSDPARTPQFCRQIRMGHSAFTSDWPPMHCRREIEIIKAAEKRTRLGRPAALNPAGGQRLDTTTKERPAKDP